MKKSRELERGERQLTSTPYRKAAWKRMGPSAMGSNPFNHTQLSFTASQSGNALPISSVKFILDTGSSNFIFNGVPTFSKVVINSFSPSTPLPKTDCKMKNKTCVSRKALSLSLKCCKQIKEIKWQKMGKINTTIHIGECLVTCQKNSLSHAVMEQLCTTAHSRAALFLQPNVDCRKGENCSHRASCSLCKHGGRGTSSDMC